MNYPALALMALLGAPTAGTTPGLPQTSGAGRLAPPSAPSAPSNEPSIEAFAVPGSSIERLRATVAIDAPLERVRQVVFDFPRYPDFMPNYSQVVVERRTPEGGADVRFDLDEMGGAVHLWMRMAVSPPTSAGAVESRDGRLLAGNVKVAEMRWELEPLSPTRTRLTLESHVDPDLSLVPAALVNSTGRGRMREVMLAFKARSERKAGK